MHIYICTVRGTSYFQHAYSVPCLVLMGMVLSWHARVMTLPSLAWRVGTAYRTDSENLIFAVCRELAQQCLLAFTRILRW